LLRKDDPTAPWATGVILSERVVFFKAGIQNNEQTELAKKCELEKLKTAINL
jgi:hypothetical protein